MKTQVLFFFLSALLITVTAAAQGVAPAVTPQANTIYTGAEGKFEAAPDTVVLRLDIAAQDDTSHAAYDKASAAAERARQDLKANGIDPKAAQVGFYSVQPMYDWKNPKRKVIGYRVTTNITLKLRDFSKVGALTGQLADIEETQNQSLNYILEDIEQAKAKAAEDARKKARSQAAAVASAGGRALGELLFATVDVYQQIVPIPMTARSMAAGVAPTAPAPPTAELTPQTVTVNAHVNAMFALK